MQPHWNPQKVNQIVMNAMPSCNKRGPIQEFFNNNQFDDTRLSQHHHKPDLGKNLPYAHHIWFNDYDPHHYFRPVVDVVQTKEGFGGCTLCQIIKWTILACFLFYLYKIINKK